jgi:hypothetical protein
VDNENPEVEMRCGNGRRGATILRTDYEVVSSFIFSQLQGKDVIDTQQLIDEARNTLSPLHRGEIIRGVCFK